MSTFVWNVSYRLASRKVRRGVIASFPLPVTSTGISSYLSKLIPRSMERNISSSLSDGAGGTYVTGAGRSFRKENKQNFLRFGECFKPLRGSKEDFPLLHFSLTSAKITFTFLLQSNMIMTSKTLIRVTTLITVTPLVRDNTCQDHNTCHGHNTRQSQHLSQSQHFSGSPHSSQSQYSSGSQVYLVTCKSAKEMVSNAHVH